MYINLTVIYNRIYIFHLYLGCVFRHPATHNARHRIKKSVFRQPFVELVNPATMVTDEPVRCNSFVTHGKLI